MSIGRTAGPTPLYKYVGWLVLLWLWLTLVWVALA